MSYRTITVHGVGFCFGCNICKRPERLVQFLENHKDSFFKLANSKYSKDDLQNFLTKAISLKENYLESNKSEPVPRVRDLFDFFNNLNWLFEELSGDIGSEEGIGTIIACIMQKETEISVDYFHGDEGGPVIMLSYACPWEFTEREKCLTYESFHTVCKKYYDELGISEDGAEFGDQEVVYCG